MVIVSSAGHGHRRRCAGAVVYDQRGDNGGGRERQRAGIAEKSVSVQDPRNAAGPGTADPGKRHGGCGRDRNRRGAGQKTMDVVRAQRHRRSGVV